MKKIESVGLFLLGQMIATMQLILFIPKFTFQLLFSPRNTILALRMMLGLMWINLVILLVVGFCTFMVFKPERFIEFLAFLFVWNLVTFIINIGISFIKNNRDNE